MLGMRVALLSSLGWAVTGVVVAAIIAVVRRY